MTTQIRRGNPFSAIVTIPAEVKDDALADVLFKAEIRKEGNSLPSGYVDELNVVWHDTEEDEGNIRALALSAKDTSHWPLGMLEYDVKIEQANGNTYFLPVAQVEITDTVTR